MSAQGAYEAWENDKRRREPRLDTAELWQQFRPYFHGKRVRVESPYGYVRTGTVSVTTGHKPGFLLMHRSNDVGSCDLLSEDDRVTAVQYRRGGPYVEVSR